MIEAKCGSEWVVRLQDGESVTDALRGLQDDAALILMGIGMIRDAQLGYWNGSEYEVHSVAEPAELVGLQGNLAINSEGERIVHVHLTLSSQNGTVHGGHLIAATVHNTLEMALLPLDHIAMERRGEPSGLVGLFPRTK